MKTVLSITVAYALLAGFQESCPSTVGGDCTSGERAACRQVVRDTSVSSEAASQKVSVTGESGPRAKETAESVGEWRVYGGSPRNDKYSDLTQINRHNVQHLKVAWRFDTMEPGGSHTNPLVIGSTLYAYTPELKVIALDAATGELRWRFDAGIRGVGPSRGLVYYSHGNSGRLLAGVMNYLYALDAKTGKPVTSFGEKGAIDLRKGLGGHYADHYVSLTSPGIVYRDLIIVGFRTSETMPAPPGDIRAYDIRTGVLRWVFHTIPYSNEFGSETWPPNARRSSGAANSWAGFALDERRGIVYVPTGSPAPDFYGGERVGNNLFANSLLALDAATGERLWHFQMVHHDLWDRDVGSPPTLLTVMRHGRRVDAVAQSTKQGFVYVFDRVTGAPLFPIEERAVPRSAIEGEVAAATQPLPVSPEPFARQLLTESMLTNRTPQAHAWALNQFRSFRSEGPYVPLSLGRQTVVFPGFDGGAEWGGAAADPNSGVLYINSNDVAWTGGLVRTVAGGGVGVALYQEQCAVCHGIDRQGSPPAFPSLADIGNRLSEEQMKVIILSGKNRMPSFAHMPEPAVQSLLTYLRADVKLSALAAIQAKEETSNERREMTASVWSEGKPARFQFTGFNKFLDPDGYPAVAPPWGTLNAIDLNTGMYLWKVPLGEYPELAKKGVKNTGTENYGGPVVTAGGLVFIGATIYDRKIRAFDSKTGTLLWEAELPFAGTATPATYMINGKQYVVIATSNNKNPKANQGGAYVAFALP